jgi:MoxR-like ATPase
MKSTSHYTTEVVSIPLTDIPLNSVCTKSVSARFTTEIREMLQNDDTILTHVYGLSHVKRRITEALMTGNGVILKGEFGVGKTELARGIFSVLQKYYLTHHVYMPVGCPVRENALNLYHYLIERDSTALDTICPLCRHAFIDSGISPSEVMVQRVFLDEGRGFARVQGNEDIEPERILGMYHLSRYAEIGDPFDPRVLEPGKIAHSSGGILFVDELGLLNKEAQYALIQGLQEKHFTPTNSRMSFPVDFLFVSTTNSINEYQIHRAILNRLVGVRIDRVSADDEKAIAKKELDILKLDVIFPDLFLDFVIESIRTLNNASVYLGPRSSIRAVQIASASALIDGRNIVEYCDLKEGIHTEMVGQTDDDSYEESLEVLEKDFPSIADFLSKKLPPLEEISALYGFEDVMPPFEDIDEEIIERIMSSLDESERTQQDIVSLYIEAYMRGYQENAH